MPTSTEPDEIALQHGLGKKRNNAIAAALCGGIPAAIFFLYFPCHWKQWLIGLIIGIVWANAFEYAYHRWLLHRPRSALGKGHLQHHANVGTPEEAEHVTLGESPLHVVILFAANGILAAAIDLLLGLSIMPGIFIGWAAYLIATEEVHWRIHMDGWLPWGIRLARAYHMRHHDVPDSRYNVFLPVFDLLLGSNRRPAT